VISAALNLETESATFVKNVVAHHAWQMIERDANVVT